MGNLGDISHRTTISVVDWGDPAAVVLRAEMDAEIGPRYAGVEIPEAGDALSVDHHAVVLTVLAWSGDGEAIGHAALRRRSAAFEVKRMFVRPAYRGLGVAATLLEALESDARTQGVDRLVLQTGSLQPEAVRFYERAGYVRIPVFPPYDVVPLSICFEKYAADSER